MRDYLVMDYLYWGKGILISLWRHLLGLPVKKKSKCGLSMGLDPIRGYIKVHGIKMGVYFKSRCCVLL